MAVVSIGMPVFNGGETLRVALQSLVNQTFPDFDLLISDNGSTDDTAAIVQEFAESDRRLRYVRQPFNIGAVGNFDFVFENTSGELFAWAAADDIRDALWLEKSVAALRSQPNAVLAASDIAMVHDINEWLAPSCHVSYHSLTDGISDPQPHVRYRTIVRPGGWAATYGLMRRSALANTRRLSAMPELKALGIAVDYVLMEMCLQGPFAYLPEVLLVNQVRERTQEELTKYLSGSATMRVNARSPFWWLCFDTFRIAQKYGLTLRQRLDLHVEFWRCSRLPGTLHSFLVDRNLEASLAAKSRWVRNYLAVERDVILAPNRGQMQLRIRELSAELASCRRDLIDRTRRLERHIERRGPE